MPVSNVYNQEKWSAIDSHYCVSTLGRIKSIRTGRILKPLKTTTGYYMIQLSNNGVKKQYKIHRLVASAFIENHENKPEVNHIDGNPLNNMVYNLEWVTRSENVKHAYEIGLNKKNRPVAAMDLSGNTLKIYKSARDAEQDGYSNQLIAKCCNGKRRKHKGRMWKYA